VETPEQQRAEAALDEATREVAADELDTTEPRGTGFLGFFLRLRRRGVDPDPDPGDERGLREVLHENDAEE